MKAADVKVYAALGIAGIALAVSVHATLRANRAEERQQQLERAAAPGAALPQPPEAPRPTPSQPPSAVAPPALAPPSVAAPSAPGRDPGPRFYSSIEASNPAVTVRQKPDGTYDVSTRDPSLSGSIITVKARTAAGEEDQLLVRVP